MTTVTYVTRKFIQPYGGFLKVSEFEMAQFGDDIVLNDGETLHPSIIGMATQYLSEFMLGEKKEEVFKVSLQGAYNVGLHNPSVLYLENIQGLDDNSIINACRLSGYDVIYRMGRDFYRPVEDFMIDQNTIENIKTMVNRSVKFFNDNGPVIDSGMTFEGAYTHKIRNGDGDILTADGLWDMKVSKNKITNKHTLQVLVYYLMGLRSSNRERFKQVERIGFFNPRLNVSYFKYIKSIPSEIIQTVEREVIGY